MASPARVAVVTGANKGIGLAIVRNIALKYPSSPLNSGPLLIYLTARSSSRGADALKALEADDQLKQHKALSSDGGLTSLSFHALDISDKESISTFAKFLKDKHPQGVDVVVNNAGIALQGFDANVVQETLATNYHGTLAACRAFLPLLRQPGGRLVNVSSMAGKLEKYSDAIREAFHAAAAGTDVHAVTTLLGRFHEAVAQGREKEDGWPSAAYAVSKAGVTAMTKVLANQQKKEGTGIEVNACCPGYVSTDMSKHKGTLTPDEGARTPVHLAVGETKGVSGEFWEKEAVSKW